jgi:hypothetical protein
MVAQGRNTTDTINDQPSERFHRHGKPKCERTACRGDGEFHPGVGRKPEDLGTDGLDLGNDCSGTYTVTISGTSGTLSHSTTMMLVVSGPPDFSISASPSSQTVTQGNSTNYTASISALSGLPKVSSFTGLSCYQKAYGPWKSG